MIIVDADVVNRSLCRSVLSGRSLEGLLGVPRVRPVKCKNLPRWTMCCGFVFQCMCKRKPMSPRESTGACLQGFGEDCFLPVFLLAPTSQSPSPMKCDFEKPPTMIRAPSSSRFLLVWFFVHCQPCFKWRSTLLCLMTIDVIIAGPLGPKMISVFCQNSLGTICG